MTASDRRLTYVTAGLIALSGLCGCRSAHYQTADNAASTSTYAGTPVPAQQGPTREPPSAFGPSEPVPAMPADEYSENPAPESNPDDVPSARSYDAGPTLQSMPEDDPAIDEDLKFPEAKRRPANHQSLRARLSAARHRVFKSHGARQQSAPPTAVVKIQPRQGRADDRATAKLVEHSDNQPLPDRPELEPVLLADPPSLVAPPVRTTDDRPTDSQALRIERIALCSEVRGFDDVVQVDPQRLASDSGFLIYAALQNFRSRASQNGFHTLTRSQVELRTLSGDVVWRQALGTANDMSAKPRHEYFLALPVALPARIPAGNYILSLRVEDLLGEQSTTSQVAVRLHGGS